MVFLRGTSHRTAAGSRHGVGVHHTYLAPKTHGNLDTAVFRCSPCVDPLTCVHIIFILYIYIYMYTCVPWSATMARRITLVRNIHYSTNGSKWITNIRMSQTILSRMANGPGLSSTARYCNHAILKEVKYMSIPQEQPNKLPGNRKRLAGCSCKQNQPPHPF